MMEEEEGEERPAVTFSFSPEHDPCFEEARERGAVTRVVSHALLTSPQSSPSFLGSSVPSSSSSPSPQSSPSISGWQEERGAVSRV